MFDWARSSPGTGLKIGHYPDVSIPVARIGFDRRGSTILVAAAERADVHHCAGVALGFFSAFFGRMPRAVATSTDSVGTIGLILISRMLSPELLIGQIPLLM